MFPPIPARTDSALGFGPFESSLDVETPGGHPGVSNGHAEQVSTIVGEAIVVRGTTTGASVAYDNVYDGSYDSRSDFYVSFRLNQIPDPRWTARLEGRIGSKAAASPLFGGWSRAGVQVSVIDLERNTVVQQFGSECVTASCADSTTFSFTRDLFPGRYGLQVSCASLGHSGGADASGAAWYDVRMSLGGIVVSNQPTTWTVLKAFYR